MFQLNTYTPSGPILETVIAGDCRLPDGLFDTSIITPSSKYLKMHGLIPKIKKEHRGNEADFEDTFTQ